ncbi:hypothetical protein V6K52_10110 [Knoellia sp. S7-12]|uniref:hypothetical protein n=1 Tax=Knoellia sp. S7-12 TaxID=3126698 RepID=UPI00336982FA
MTYPTDEEPPLVGETIARMALSVVPFGGAVDIMLEDTRKRLAYRVRQTVEEIVDETGEDVLATRLAESPDVEAVFVQGIEAATRTGYEAKRRLLSRVVTAAVLDDARIDEGLLVVMALRDLDAPHLRTLAVMRRAVAEAEREDALLPPEVKGDGAFPPNRLIDAVVGAIATATAEIPWVVIAGLTRSGALEPRGTLGSIERSRAEHFQISHFGEQLLAHLSEVGDSASPPSM